MCAFSGHVRVCAGTHVVSSPWDCTTQTYQKSAHRRNPSLCTWNQISITHIYQTDHSNLSHSTLTIKSLITLYLLAWTMECERQYILCFAHVHRVEYIDDCVTFHQKKSLAIYLIYYSESEFIMITNCIFALTHSDSTDIMKIRSAAASEMAGKWRKNGPEYDTKCVHALTAIRVTKWCVLAEKRSSMPWIRNTLAWKIERKHLSNLSSFDRNKPFSYTCLYSFSCFNTLLNRRC